MKGIIYQNIRSYFELPTSYKMPYQSLYFLFLYFYNIILFRKLKWFNLGNIFVYDKYNGNTWKKTFFNVQNTKQINTKAFSFYSQMQNK